MNNNKLIAEFMGVEKTYNPSTEKVLSYAVNDDVQCLPHELQYHTEWNWLMPVVEKIFALAVADENIELFYDVQTHIPDKTATYNAVVEFIQEYRLTPKEVV